MDISVDLDATVSPEVRQYVVLAVIQHLIEKLQEIDGGGPVPAE